MAFQTRSGAAAPTRTAAPMGAASIQAGAQSAALSPVMSQAVTYKANGEEVTLSFADVKAFICESATDAECKLFLEHCRYNRLNPFIREAYLIKYQAGKPAAIVTGKAAFEKRAEEHPQFDGYEAGLVLLAGGKVEYREGSAFYPGEELLGGWAKVYRKDRRIPNFEEVKLEEYIQRKSDGSANSQWTTRPGTMIRKVALVHALREAFPAVMGSLYSADEMGVPADFEGEFADVSQTSRTALPAPPQGYVQQPDAPLVSEDDPFAAPAAPGGDPA